MVFAATTTTSITIPDSTNTMSDATTPLLSSSAGEQQEQAAGTATTTIITNDSVTNITTPTTTTIMNSNNTNTNNTSTTTGLQQRRSSPTIQLRTSNSNNNNNNNHDNNNSNHHHHDNNRNSNRWEQYRKEFIKILLLPITDVDGSLDSIMKGFFVMIIIGTLIGFITPINTIFPIWYGYLSNCIGYIYFVAWSVSFYPQVLQNIQRKTTVGLSIDFCCLNIIGFMCYTTYTCTLYFNTTIQQLYHERYGNAATITIQANDIAFAIHALTLSILTVVQILYYDGLHTAIQRLSKPIISIIILILSIATIAALVVLTNQSHKKDFYSVEQGVVTTFNWLDYIYLLSYIKIGISIIKYIPQVLLNYQRQSTIGWSVWQILLDFMGGILSDIQLAGDCYIHNGNFSAITENLPKFGLGFISILFDIIFMFQHYVLYKNNNNNNRPTNGGETLNTNTNTPLGSEETNNNNNNETITSNNEEAESLINSNTNSTAITQLV